MTIDPGSIRQRQSSFLWHTPTKELQIVRQVSWLAGQHHASVFPALSPVTSWTKGSSLTVAGQLRNYTGFPLSSHLDGRRTMTCIPYPFVVDCQPVAAG